MRPIDNNSKTFTLNQFAFDNIGPSMQNVGQSALSVKHRLGGWFFFFKNSLNHRDRLCPHGIIVVRNPLLQAADSVLCKLQKTLQK
jgi:hypothetical protein